MEARAFSRKTAFVALTFVALIAASCEHNITGGIGALASITVTTNPDTLVIGTSRRFIAVGRDAGGGVVNIDPTWSVVSGGTINNSGVLTAGMSTGTFANTVVATVGSISGNATLTVIAGPPAGITVTPVTTTLAVGQTQQFTAVVVDAGGNVLPTAPSWAVGAGGGNITNMGLFTASGAAGTYNNTVSASVGSISDSSSVTVTAGALATITVTPNPSTVQPGASQQFTATGRDAGGNVVSFTPSWSIQAGGGTITSTGLFTAGTAPGTFPNTVRACSITGCFLPPTFENSMAGFATVTVPSPAPPSGSGPSLGAAATHGILAGSAVSCASAPGLIDADVSVWPGSAITGFPPCTINGQRHAADPYAQTAQTDLTTAYNQLQAMPCGTTITSDLGGTTLAAGVYCSTSSVGVTGVVTLTGNSTDVFVIRAASTLTTAGSVVLSGGALARNVFWVVGSSATLGTGSAWQGNVIAFTTITLVDNVTLTGRALARNGAVSLGTNTSIVLP
jgi:hypothetical protein